MTKFSKCGRCLSVPLFAFFMLGARPAHATSEAGALDGRFEGMGAAGLAPSDGAMSMFHNPATIGSRRGNGDFVLSLAVALTYSRVPVAGPNQEQDSHGVLPAGFLAGTYRVLPKLTLGAAVQPSGGSGGKFTVNGFEISSNAFALEGDVAAAYEFTDRFSLGVMYRVAYLAATSKFPPTAPGGSPSETSLSAADFFAFSAGAAYRLGDETSATRLGFNFRSRISADLQGDTKMAGASFDTTSHFALPDKFSLGISQELLDKRLLLSAQGGLIMYGWLDGTTTTTIKTPPAPVTLKTTANDMTVWEAKVGGEFWAVPETFAVRAGVWFGPEQARDERVSLSNNFLGFYVTPSVGAGVRVGRLDLDAGALVGIPHGKTVAFTSNGNPGEYSNSQVSMVLSGRYKFD